MKFYEQHWYHQETNPRPPHPVLNNNINLDLQDPAPCPECQGPTKYEADHDETVCTQCGLVVSTSHKYVRGQRIYIPFIDDTPSQPEFDRVAWWSQFLINFKPFIYPDDRRYFKG